MATESLQNTAAIVCTREKRTDKCNESCDYSFPAVTWEHVQVVVQVVGAAQEAEEEDKGVGGPGDGPEQEQQQPAPPQRPLALQPHTVKLLKNI